MDSRCRLKTKRTTQWSETQFSSIRFHYTRFLFCTHFGVSRVVCGAPLRLLAPWTTLLLSKWMLHWWRVKGSTAREPFPRTRPLKPITRLNKAQLPFFSSFRYDPAGNRTNPTSFGGPCSLVSSTVPFSSWSNKCEGKRCCMSNCKHSWRRTGCRFKAI